LIDDILNIIKWSLTLLIIHSIAMNMLTLSNANKYIEKDLLTLNINSSMSKNALVLKFVSFDLNAKNNITMYISAYELKYLSSCVNKALRLLLSNHFNVTLVITNGKWTPSNVFPRADLCYCWGPNCPTQRPLGCNVLITDNPQGSYQFMNAILTEFGDLGKLESKILLKEDILYSRPYKLGVWVNSMLWDVGSPLIPYYCINPTKFIVMLESALGK